MNVQKQETNRQRFDLQENRFCFIRMRKSFCFHQLIDKVELYKHNWDFHLVDHFEYMSQHAPSMMKKKKKKNIEE